MVVALAWLSNQVIGFAILGYPMTGSSFAWGIAIGLAALLAFIGAGTATASASRRSYGLATSFASSFVVYELVLRPREQCLSSSSDAFCIATVSRIFEINLISFVGLLLLHRLVVAAASLQQRGRAGDQRGVITKSKRPPGALLAKPCATCRLAVSYALPKRRLKRFTFSASRTASSGFPGYAVRPPEVRREKPGVSAFTSADIPKIAALKPDLVFAFSDLPAPIAADLARAGLAVHVFNQRDIAGIFAMIRTLGALIGCPEKADRLAVSLKDRIDAIHSETQRRRAVRASISRNGTSRS